MKTADVCRKHGISSATLYAWKAKYGGMDVSQARKLKVLEEENARSEEHTSELQSLMRISYAVFCLKKKKTQKSNETRNHKTTSDNKKTSNNTKQRKINSKQTSNITT